MLVSPLNIVLESNTGVPVNIAKFLRALILKKI